MAVSTSWDFTSTRNEIITEALEFIRVIGEGDTPSTEQFNSATRTLNMMIKDWQKDGIFLWKLEERTKVFTASSRRTGSDGLYYRCIKSHTSVTATNKPITGTEWNTYWILDGASTDGAWANGASYVASGIISLSDNEVIGINKAFLRTAGTDRELEVISRKDYLEISDKGTHGEPNKIFCETRLDKVNFYLHPQPDDITQILHYDAYLRLKDFDIAGNNPDMDNKYILTLAVNLAFLLSFKYKVSRKERDDLASYAMNLKLSMFNDGENTGLDIRPDIRRR